ncbi:metallophosphoesterase [Geopseudomonas aromaticivorans]
MMVRNPAYTPVLRLPINLTGRDFIIGDVHGDFDPVIEGMREARFDGRVDRILSVGDLIDRGPGSHRVVRFLQQPYVHAVRGNHEDMLLQMYAGGDLADDVMEVIIQRFGMRNGMGWWLDISPEQRTAILDVLRPLPVAIEVETMRGTVGLVHGDVPRGMDWPTFLRKLEAGDQAVRECALEGRDRLSLKDKNGVVVGNHEGVMGVGRLFVGHTPQWSGVKRLGNVYAIDTGSVFNLLADKEGARLTIANIAMQTMNLTEPRPAARVELRDGVEPVEPFGAYASEMRQP